MSIEIRGYEGTQARIAEIQAKLKSLNPEAPKQNSFAKDFDAKLLSSTPAMGGRLGSRTSFDPPFAPPFDPVSAGLLGAPATDDLPTLARTIAQQNGIDPELFNALVKQESGFNPKAVSAAGAMGLTQLMPKTAQSLRVADPFDARQNLEGGARYLAQLLKQFDGNRELALAAYNAGPGAVKRAGGIPPYPETQNYVRSILGAIGG